MFFVQSGRRLAKFVERGTGLCFEQALLQREMVEDLVQQIIRGVNAAVTAAPPAASGSAA